MDVPTEIKDLLARVPRPPEGADCSASDEETIGSFEQRLGIAVPPILRDWLLTVNGAPFGPGGVFGIATGRKAFDMERYLAEYPEWQEHAELALNWFYGRNALGALLVDPETGACSDGLEADGPNANQGAESCLAYLGSVFSHPTSVPLVGPLPGRPAVL